jgi:hypothetical protein
LEVDLAAIAGAGQASGAEDAGVQFGAQSEAMPALAALEADAPGAVGLGQFADGDFKELRCFVKFQESIFPRKWEIANSKAWQCAEIK